MKRYVITSIALTVGVIGAQAADALVTNAPPKNPWDASASLGATLTRGNSKTLLVSGQFMANKKFGQNEINLGADGVYGENEVTIPGDGKTTQTSANAIHGFAQYNRLFSDRFFGFGRVEALNDQIALVHYRVAATVGAGYYLIQKTTLTLRAEVGPGYVWENLAGVENDYATLRVAERGEWKINARAKLWESLEYLPQVDRFQNYVVNAEFGIDTAITAHLSQVTFIQDTYRSEPAAGRLHNDMKLVAGVKYKF